MANDVATTQDALYQQAVSEHANALKRLARAYESDPEIRRDLLQEIHVALWRSFADFGRLCSMRTWVFRVAHNTAATHVVRERRKRGRLIVSLEEIDALPSRPPDPWRQQQLGQLFAMIRRLKPIDRQVRQLSHKGHPRRRPLCALGRSVSDEHDLSKRAC